MGYPTVVCKGVLPMSFRIRPFLCLLACVLFLPLAAFAEDCFTIDVDALDTSRLNDNAYVSANLTAQAQGIRVRKYISDSNELAARVRLTIQQAETSAVVYDKNYGYVSGTFDSGTIYLPFVDNNVIPYLITLNIENWTYALPFMQYRPRLTGNSACTVGLRLGEQNPALSDTWIMGTMLDLDALRAQGSVSVSLCASNQYLIGQAAISVQGDRLRVDLSFADAAAVDLQACAVYLFPSVSGLTSLNPAQIAQPAYAPGQEIDITGQRSALLYLPCIVSYNPSDLPDFVYDPYAGDLPNQRTLWADNLQGVTAVQPAETATPEAPFATPVAQINPEEVSTPEAAEPSPTPEVFQSEEPTPEPSADATLEPCG